MKMSIDMSNEAQLSHVLGVDFGLSKIGLAIADCETKMAFALDTIKNDDNFLNNLRKIVEEKEVKIVVIGMTKHEKDTESAKKKKQFAEEIKNSLQVEVYFQEEMFTTKMAQENIKLHGKKHIASFDDKEAARIILQEWIDNNSF